MSLLASLVRAYERMPDAPPFGYAAEKIGFAVILSAAGEIVDIVDRRSTDKRRTPVSMVVPACPKRSGQTPRPNFLWDNINYALGGGKLISDTDTRFDAFRDKHLEYLSDLDDPELSAFCAFLRNWKPMHVTRFFQADDIPTTGIAFASADNYRDHFLHESGAAKDFWTRTRHLWVAVEGKSAAPAICLVKGELTEIARTHPPIKGMSGVGGKSEMALISFNDDAYESYGHKQGDNAPVSETAAFSYTTALNRFLDRDSGHRIQIGDASTVFWADAEDAGHAGLAEGLFSAFFEKDQEQADTEEIASRQVAAHLALIRQGRLLDEVEPRLKIVRFSVLGLAPNAARLSVRFWWQNDFGRLTAHYQRFVEDLRIEPPPRDGWPPLWRYLKELASQGKRENIPPLVAGDWMRAILNGTPYPLTLMSALLMRIRADGQINTLRAAILKSVLIRNFAREVPVALDSANTNKGYILGRLFAVYEEVQRAALGGNVNATIKDKFYGAASASPQKVYRTLDSGAQNHFSKLRKQSPGRAVNLEKLIASIMDLMEPGDDPIPASLAADEQALFGIGYYHQRSDFFRKRDNVTTAEADQ